MNLRRAGSPRFSPQSPFARLEGQLPVRADLAIHRLFDLRLEGVADQSSYQPTQRDMLLLGDFAEVAQEIIGQDNDEC